MSAAASSIPLRGSRAAASLSFAQQRLWFLEQLNPGTAVNNIATVTRISVRISAVVLQRCVDEVLRRHESLRTVFRSEEGVPVQVILAQQPVQVQIKDLGALAAVERERELSRVTAEEARRPFQLEQGPLFRVTLVRLQETHYVLLMTMHHIISDAWSLGVLSRELGLLYEAYASGRPSPLTALPIQYADFAVWQRQWLSGEVLEKQLAYWREKLTDIEPLQLWTDRPRPVVASFAGAYRTASFGTELGRALRALGREEGCTPFMTLLAAFTALLSRYSGQDDVVVGTPIANRSRPELEGLIGFFVNTLVLRTDTSGDPSFRELLRRVRETALHAYAHQDLPFEKLVEELHPQRDLSRNPLFQVAFQLFPPTSGSSPGQNVREEVPGDRGITHFDLALNLAQRGDALDCFAEYRTELYDSASVDRILQHFGQILKSALADPSLPLSRLAILSARERDQVIYRFNETERESPFKAAFPTLFEEQASKSPQAPAVSCRGTTYTYSELRQASDAFAEVLESRGLSGGPAPIAVCLPRGYELLRVMLGVWKAGAAWVAIDPAAPTLRAAAILKDSGARTCVTLPLQAEWLGEVLPEGIILLPPEEVADEPCKVKDPLRIEPDSVAYVIYTSGSTGRPKGVVVSHQALSNYLSWAREAYPSGANGSPLHSSIAFDLSFTSAFVPLLTGDCVHILDEEPGVDALAQFLRTHRDMSLLKLTPTHLNLLAHQMTAAEARGATRALVIGGESLLKEDILFWREHAPDTVLINEYGPTESVVGCCFHAVEAVETCGEAVPIGKPIWNMRAYVLDRFGNPQPLGVPGELYVAGAGVAEGYLNDPALTSERFSADPFVPGARMYRTGDSVRRCSDGSLEYLGRLDQQIKIRGFRVELQEVEAALCACPLVESATVVASANGRSRFLVAHVVPGSAATGRCDTAAAIRTDLRRSLPEYMIPSKIVLTQALPLGPSGKVDRSVLLTTAAFAPERRQLVVPRTDLERAIAGVWSAALGTRDVSATDDFFVDLGGHSLLATQVISELCSMLQIQIPLRLLFEQPTLEGFSTALEGDDDRRDRITRSLQLIRFVADLSSEEVSTLMQERDHTSSGEARTAAAAADGRDGVSVTARQEVS